MIEHISVTTSTNDLARNAKYREGDIIWADFQTAGRGQRGHTWESRAGENLTFSAVLEPSFLPAREQFLLSEAVALALVDMLSDYGIEARIKWTNDIYVGDRKIVGILIEHTYSGSRLSRTIAGIGINVNQREFSADLPNPTSMLRECEGREFDCAEVLARFEQALAHRYSQLREGAAEQLQRDYHERMYRLNEQHTYALPSGERFEATLRGVLPSGDLLLDHADGSRHSYLFKEVEFVIASRR